MTDNLELERTMISRKQKGLSDKDIAKISDTHHNWRKESESGFAGFKDYQDIAGFCKSSIIEDVRKNNYILTPSRYIDFKEVAEEGIVFAEKMATLTQILKEQMQKANELDEAIKQNLAKIGYAL
jgi:type I restriction enzyme M protein